MFEIREKFRNTHPDIVAKVLSDEYSFLRTNEHLGNRIALLCLGGSYAYGLNNENSDVDIRGVALNTKEEILGMSNFEQFINQDTDTTIYGMKKFIKLMSECNPNIIEMLYCRPEDYLYISPIGQMLIDNREMFLSQRAVKSFSGYAMAQIKRIESATARDRLSDYKKQEHIASGAQNAVDNLMIRHELEEYGEIKFHVDEETAELLLDCNYNSLPVKEWVDLMNATKQVLNEYNNTTGRNKKKDDAHLNKHMSHVVRLIKMGIEVLTEHRVYTYREKDRDFLLDIKNGKYMTEDGLFTQELWDYVYGIDKELVELKNKTTLPVTCDLKKVEDLIIRINELSLKETEC